MPKISELFIDLDGTLLDSKKELDTLAVSNIPKLLDLDINIWLCSGRPNFYIESIKNKIDLRVKVIGFNGAMINQDIIGFIDVEKIEEIILKIGIEALIFKNNQTIYSSKIPVQKGFGYPDFKIEEKHVQDYINEKILKIIILSNNQDYPYQRKMLETISGIEISSYKDIGFEISPIGISKGSAAKSVKKRDGYSIAIGNDSNDITLFNVCDYKVAMRNSSQSLRELADEIISSNDQQGVGQYLKKLLESRIQNETH